MTHPELTAAELLAAEARAGTPLVVVGRIRQLLAQQRIAEHLLGTDRPPRPEPEPYIVGGVDLRHHAVAQLDALQDPLARRLLELHRRRPSFAVTRWSCDGDDYEGYEAENPVWPCSTVLAIAEHHGIEVPENGWWTARPRDGSLDQAEEPVSGSG